MQNDPLAPTVTIQLDRPRSLVFDLNTFAAYEKETGKSFFATLSTLTDIVKKLPRTDDGKVDTESVDGLQIIRNVQITDIRAMVWAACHEYKRNDDPVWPLTVHQVGRLIHLGNIASIVSALMTGSVENAPNEEERINAGEPSGVQPMPSPVIVPPLSSEDGGGQ